MRLFIEFFVMIFAGGILGAVVASTLACCALFPTDYELLSVVKTAWPIGFWIGAVLGFGFFGAEHNMGPHDGD